MSSLSLDLRTLSVSLVLVTTFLSCLMIYTWRVYKTYPGFNLWVISNATMAVGFGLLSFRGMIPDFFTVILGNTIVYAGMLFSFEGTREFLGVKSKRLFSGVLFVLHASFLVYFTYFRYSFNGRIIIISLFLAILSAHVFYVFSRNFANKESFTHRFTAATYLAFSLMMAVRTVFTYLFSNITNYYTPDWVQSIAYMTFIAFTIVWTFNYMVLNNQRLQNELLATQRDLEKAAATDFLTGVNNGRRFFEISENEVNRARRFGNSLAVIMLDIDYFKKINDTHGHAAGDAVLVKVAEICQTKMRNIDVTGRLGGEEFAVLLPHTDTAGARVVAENLRAAIEAARIEFASEIIKVTASFGVSELFAADTQINAALDRADGALYRAKRAGRNQVAGETLAPIDNAANSSRQLAA